MKAVTVSVTLDDIYHGRRNSLCSCPVALAHLIKAAPTARKRKEKKP